MNLQTFVADSAADAVDQIRAQLGPDAVVVNVRQVPGRWFGKGKIEVQAHVPERAPEPSPVTGTLLNVTDEPVGNEFPQLSGATAPAIVPLAPASSSSPDIGGAGAPGHTTHGSWSHRAGDRIDRKHSNSALLESLGLMPVYAARVLECVDASRPPWMPADVPALRRALAAAWLPVGAASATTQPVVHVFVGAPGTGKTTALSKWLTLSVLLGGRSARVWRLDGVTANTSEALSVHCDVLGVPASRSWSDDDALVEDAGYVDLPGVTWSDANAVRELAGQVGAIGRRAEVAVHLVVNAAYESPVMLAQARAFAAALPVADIIVSHLDEEPRWGKLWNLMLGTGLPIRYLSSGQNIPGEFVGASAERVLSAVFEGS
jgi:flagellar biosynthesis GTPase FlhF